MGAAAEGDGLTAVPASTMRPAGSMAAVAAYASRPSPTTPVAATVKVDGSSRTTAMS